MAFDGVEGVDGVAVLFEGWAVFGPAFVDVGRLMFDRGFRHVPLIQRADPPYEDTGIPVGLARLEIWMKVAFDALSDAGFAVRTGVAGLETAADFV